MHFELIFNMHVASQTRANAYHSTNFGSVVHNASDKWHTTCCCCHLFDRWSFSFAISILLAAPDWKKTLLHRLRIVVYSYFRFVRQLQRFPSFWQRHRTCFSALCCHHLQFPTFRCNQHAPHTQLTRHECRQMIELGRIAWSTTNFLINQFGVTWRRTRFFRFSLSFRFSLFNWHPSKMKSSVRRQKWNRNVLLCIRLPLHRRPCLGANAL